MNNEAMTSYYREDIFIPDAYGKPAIPQYRNNPIGKILVAGAACSLMAVYNYSPAQADINSIERDVVQIESCEHAMNANIRELKKVIGTVSGDRLEQARKELINQIISFKSLNENWDGYGAIPLGVKCASSAIEIARNIENTAIDNIEDCFPNTNGSISIQWKNKSGERLSLSIGEDTFSYYCKRNGIATEYFNNVAINEDGIRVLSASIQSIVVADV